LFSDAADNSGSAMEPIPEVEEGAASDRADDVRQEMETAEGNISEGELIFFYVSNCNIVAS
jgi:hypothetical protein